MLWNTRLLKILHRWLILSSVLLSHMFGQIDEKVSVDITFESEGHALKGKFFRGKSGAQSPTLLLLHGFPGNQQDVLGLGQRLSAAGVKVLAFNYSGTHKSEGDFSMEQAQGDIEAAHDYLHQTDIVSRFGIDTNRIVLGGYSFGGGMALSYAARHPEIRRVISISGTDHGEFSREYLRNPQMVQSMDSMFDKLRAPGGPIRFEGSGALKKLAANPDSFDLRLTAGNLASRDILLVGGWDDAQITIDHHLLPFYRALREAGATRTTVVAFHTDHSFRNVREELADQLIRWMKADTVENIK